MMAAARHVSFWGKKRWMASQMGELGGRASSDAKKAASRENGKLGAGSDRWDEAE